MTDHEIRVRVAELLGWTEVHHRRMHDLIFGLPPGETRRNRWRIPPDYPTDLNAAVAAVRELEYGYSIAWDESIGGILIVEVGGETVDSVRHDPARALCLALLKAEGASASTDRTEGEPPSSDQTRGSSTENGRSPRAGAAQEGRRS